MAQVQSTAAGRSSTDWYLLKSSGAPIGHMAVRTFNNRDAQITEIENTNHFRRDGSAFDLTSKSRFINTPGGQPVAFTHSYALPNQDNIQSEGRIEHIADRTLLDLKVQNYDRVSSGETALNGQFLFPGGPTIEDVYKSHFNDRPGTTFGFQTLHMALAPQVVDTKVTIEDATPENLSGKPVRKFAVRNAAKDNAAAVYEWRDATGKLMLARSPGDNMEMVYASEQQVTGSQQCGGWLDVVADTEIVTNVIPMPRRTYEAVYRIEPLTGQNVNWDYYFPETRRQRILEIGMPTLSSAMQDGVVLKVMQKEPYDALVKAPIRYEKQFLQATPYLQSDDDLIRRTAEEAAGVEKRAYYAARKLQKWVYDNIPTKDLSTGFASAKETLVKREGDCTEHAVLLAAMARSLGIPSRVAVGFVYLPENSTTTGHFVYHMWTEVFIGDTQKGDWVPLDATNPEPVPDATHIKIADSPLTDINDLMTLSQAVVGLMGKIKIKVVKALSPVESVLTVGKSNGVLNVDIPRMDLASFDLRAMTRRNIQYYRVDLPPESLSLESPEGLFSRGVELLARNRYGDARSAFDKSLERLENPMAFYRMGERFTSIEMYDYARRAFDAAVQNDRRLAGIVDSWKQAYLPASPLARETEEKFMAGLRQQMELGDNAAAEARFREVTSEAPAFAPGWMHLGQTLAARGDYPGAMSAYQRASAANPNDYRPYERMGDANMDRAHYTEAAGNYQQASNLLKNRSFAYSKRWLEDLSAQNKIATAAGLISRNGKSAQGWTELGKAFLMQKRQGEAYTAFTNALSLQPGYGEAVTYQYLCLLERADWQRLHANYGKIAAMSAGNAFAARLKGQYEMRTRQYGKAVTSLQHAIALVPARPDAYLLLAETYERIADQQRQAGKPDKTQLAAAVTTLQNGRARVTPAYDKLPILKKLGAALLANNRSQEAEAVADQMLAIQPVLSDAYALKGEAQLYQGRFADARASLETALAINPDDVGVLGDLGNVAREEGRDTLAVDYYQKALKIDPAAGRTAEAMNAIIEQERLSIRKPTVYLELTPDERDYLIQALYRQGRSTAYISRLMQELMPLYQKFGKTIMDLASIEAKEKLAADFNTAYDKTLAHYNTIKAMKAPPRFASLKTELEKAVYADLEFLKLGLANYPRSEEDGKTVDAANAELARIKQAATEQQVRMIGYMAMLESRLSTPVYLAVIEESGLQDLMKDLVTPPSFSEISGKADPKAAKSKTAAPKPATAPKN